jgi:hypothetical protein
MRTAPPRARRPTEGVDEQPFGHPTPEIEKEHVINQAVLGDDQPGKGGERRQGHRRMVVHEATEPLAVNRPRGRVGHADGRAGARHVAQDGEFADQVTGGDHGEESDPAIGCGGGDLHPSAEDAVHSLWRITLAILGAVRPFIGSVFGIIVHALDQADLLPLKPPDSGAKDLYFYAAIAFFAGFSERWAQSTLKNAIPLSGPSAPPSDTRVLSSHSEGKLVGR